MQLSLTTSSASSFSQRSVPMFERALAVLAIVLCSTGAFGQKGPGAALERIDRDDLCVTNGAVLKLPGGRLAVEAESSRAVLRASLGQTPNQVAEIRFRYLGSSQTMKPLASGELRRQIGLKLRAEDTCNLIYAMWHIEPDSRIAVSIKHNAGMHTHEQCRAGGYRNIKAPRQLDLSAIRPGEAHTLRAELRGDDLTVTADGKVAWQGTLGNDAPSLVGPTGFRTDNARFEFDYYTDRATKTRLQTQRAQPGPGHCAMSEGD
jgi:hypothetical protein